MQIYFKDFKEKLRFKNLKMVEFNSFDVKDFESIMVENFDMEALVLTTLTYITLIFVILRIVLALCQFKIKNKIDQAERVRGRSLSLEKVIVMKADENKQNLNKHKYYEKPIKNHNSTDYEKHQTVSLNSSKEDKIILPVPKNDIKEFEKLKSKVTREFPAYPSMTQSNQKRINDDESFWLHSFEESELSRENSTIPNTSAYGMRKVGKNIYIDDTNVGSPGSKALEQKSSEQIEKESAM
ncbi:hypothetical protein ACH3XW_34365 [Acanthocheilonema viteae]